MTHLPDSSRFAVLARESRLVPVYRRLFADALTPLSAFARLDSGPAACLFESVIGGEKVGRYSFLAADPFLRLEARGTDVTITGFPSFRPSRAGRSGAPPTTRSATWSGCPTRPPTISVSPTSRSPSTTGWWSSTT
jgi:anthranilate/para-aminobenzoate synthase component I